MSEPVSAAWEALGRVVDPEAGINIVDLGLIYDIRAEGDVLHVTMTLTFEGCPAGPWLVQEAEAALQGLDGVRRVEIEVTFDPPWTPERISPEGRALLGR